MAEVIFNFEGIDTSIYCNINDKMGDIIGKFLIKIERDEEDNNFIYLYNGNNINIELTFNEQANELDKNSKKMNILVKNITIARSIKKNEIISKDIICPKCKENIFIYIDKFKINLYGCKNKHNMNNILLNKYKETQIINLCEIVCDICKKKNKGNTHNNEFYICNTCNKNMCPLCKSVHDKEHKIIDYDNKNYICKEHNDRFIKYCLTCNQNICIMEVKEHNEHELFELGTIISDKNDLTKILEQLKDLLNKFKMKIKEKELLDKIAILIDEYIKINNEIVDNYDMNKRNYHKLINIYNLKNYNKQLIKDLNSIFIKDDLSKIYDFLFDTFYDDNEEKYIGEKKISW